MEFDKEIGRTKIYLGSSYLKSFRAVNSAVYITFGGVSRWAMIIRFDRRTCRSDNLLTNL